MSERPALVDAARALATDIRVSDLPDPVMAQALRAIEAIRAIVANHRHPGPYAVEQLRPPTQEFRFEPADPLGCIPYAPILGRLNPASAEASLRVVDLSIQGVVTFSALHAGPMNLVHGGALAGLCDELSALAVLAHGSVGFTREITVDYRGPARLGVPLSVRSVVEGGDERTLTITSEVEDAGRLCVVASSRFRRVGDLIGSFYQKAGAVLADRAK